MTRLTLILAILVSWTGMAQQWTAEHFAGYAVPTLPCADIPDLAELPIPGPNSPIRIVSTLTTTTTPGLLGDLTGKTLVATVWLECSNSPSFWSGGPGCINGASPNMRLFITSDSNPYTENNGRGNPSAYWWGYATNGMAPFTCGTNVLRCDLIPENWSDALGHRASDPLYTQAFWNVVSNVAQAGLSFGCYYYDTGVGNGNGDASAVLHVLQYDAIMPTVVTIQPVASDSLDGPWIATGQSILVTNPPTFIRLTISKQ